jgi:hypothetical protein
VKLADDTRAVAVLGEGVIQSEGASLGALQGLGEEIREVEDLDAPVGEDLREMVMLLLGALQPKNVVEQEVVLVLGREPEHLGSGTVQNDLPEHPDLGIDGQCHDSLSGTSLCRGIAWNRVEC